MKEERGKKNMKYERGKRIMDECYNCADQHRCHDLKASISEMEITARMCRIAKNIIKEI